MKLEVNITKKRFFVILSAIFLLAGMVAVYAATAGFSSANKKTLVQAKAGGIILLTRRLYTLAGQRRLSKMLLTRGSSVAVAIAEH
jgi:hypothetical protein